MPAIKRRTSVPRARSVDLELNAAKRVELLEKTDRRHPFVATAQLSALQALVASKGDGR